MRARSLFAGGLMIFGLLGCTTIDGKSGCHQATGPVINNATLINMAKHQVNVWPNGREVTLILLADDFFRIDSPMLLPAKEPDLNAVVAFLKQYGQAKIQIAGYNDNVGSPSHNQLVSEQQARALLTYFWTHGIPAEQLYAVGYGDRVPVADNATSHGSHANRRIEITVKAGCL